MPRPLTKQDPPPTLQPVSHLFHGQRDRLFRERMRFFQLADDVIAQHKALRLIKKVLESGILALIFVPHAGVEPAIYCVRGSCPGPLDECGVLCLKSGAKV